VVVVAGRVVLSPAAPTEDAAAEPQHGMSLLERVVVTGNAVPAPRRPLTIGLEVVDGDRLRSQALGSMAELLNATVPGMWVWSQSPSTMVAQYGGIRGASSFNASYPKIYIDGVEVANPLLVTQLNPDVVDRVEVIRGPQGSALYGSDAISGVINVLTRHDGGVAGTPFIQLRSVAGAAASTFAPGLVPTHEQRLNLRAGTNARSAGLALSFGQTGALFPASESRQITATGDARLVTSEATFTGTARLFDWRAGTGQNPLLAGLVPVSSVGAVSGSAMTAGSTMALASGVSDPQSMGQYTLSASAAFATHGIWTHSLLAGVDGYHLDHVADSSGPFPSSVDSALRAARGNGDRMTFRESSVAHFGNDGNVQTTLTLGVEQSVLRQQSLATRSVAALPGELYPQAVDVLEERWNHDTGLLSQLNSSWKDAIFLSAGLRVERNDLFSGNDRYPLLPMLGLAAVRNIGGAELKLRAAYGKGIRPPQTSARSIASGYTGPYVSSGLAPALNPEVQSGFEGGAELYFGRAFTLQITRFDQRATGLIQNVAVGVDTFSRGGYTDRRMHYELQNVGEIANKGWELQATANRGAFSLSSAFSSVDSRVRTVASGYGGDLRSGDRMLGVPAQTASMTASFAGGGWMASLGATRAIDWVNYDRLALAQAYAATGGPSEHQYVGPYLRSYWMQYDGETHLRFTTARDLRRGITLLVTGENLLGGQLGEPDNVTIRPGRTITGGLRASF
jgi:iron complex outermembrane receptor protein